jgi:uncharacterized protein (TIGR02147 family)
MSNKVTAILNAAYLRLKKEKNSVSLRSLALRMGLTGSYLSKLMRGEKNLPLHLINELKNVLHLDAVEVSELQGAVLEQIAKNSSIPMSDSISASVDLQKYENLTKQDFFLLERWYYLPLLNLVTIVDFKNDLAWISGRLGISEASVDSALKALIKHGYLKKEGRYLSRTAQKMRFPTDKSHQKIREYHQKAIEKASEVLERNTSHEDFDERLITGISFAGSSSKLKEAQVILTKAIYQVAELMSQEAPDEVFQLNLQLFKMTK